MYTNIKAPLLSYAYDIWDDKKNKRNLEKEDKKKGGLRELKIFYIKINIYNI